LSVNNVSFEISGSDETTHHFDAAAAAAAAATQIKFHFFTVHITHVITLVLCALIKGLQFLKNVIIFAIVAKNNIFTPMFCPY
jgi:hypothetical protein